MPTKTKKSKMPDNRPARARYWSENHLRRNKVKHLMQSCGFDDRGKAQQYWESVRQGRRKK